MTKKKVPQRPLYDMYEDTPWISRNRELNAQSYDLFKNALTDLGQQDQQYYEGLASRAMDSAYNDLNRNYQNAVNQNLARNYGRFGTTASTSGGYVTDSLQRQYNDMATRLASQQAQTQEQFINSALNRDLSKLQAYYTPFTNSGKITEAVDLKNYETAQNNKDRQWQNDIIRQQNKTDPFQLLSNSAAAGFKGFTQGMSTGNPWAAIGGGIGGAVSGAYNSYADPSGYYGYQDTWNNIMGNGGSAGQGITQLFSGNNTDSQKLDLTNKSNSSGFNPNFSGWQSLFGN